MGVIVCYNTRRANMLNATLMVCLFNSSLAAFAMLRGEHTPPSVVNTRC